MLMRLIKTRLAATTRPFAAPAGGRARRSCAMRIVLFAGRAQPATVHALPL